MESESISDWMFAPIIAKWTKGLSGLDRICCCVLFQTKQKLCGDSFSDVKTRRLGPSLRLHRCQVSTRRSSEMESNNATRFFLYFFFLAAVARNFIPRRPLLLFNDGKRLLHHCQFKKKTHTRNDVGRRQSDLWCSPAKLKTCRVD